MEVIVLFYVGKIVPYFNTDTKKVECSNGDTAYGWVCTAVNLRIIRSMDFFRTNKSIKNHYNYLE